MDFILSLAQLTVCHGFMFTKLNMILLLWKDLHQLRTMKTNYYYRKSYVNLGGKPC